MCSQLMSCCVFFSLQRFTRKEDVVRHYNWHKRRDNSLQHGFMRFSPSDNCSPYYPGCTINLKHTHYHCLQVCTAVPPVCPFSIGTLAKCQFKHLTDQSKFSLSAGFEISGCPLLRAEIRGQDRPKMQLHFQVFFPLLFMLWKLCALIHIWLVKKTCG